MKYGVSYELNLIPYDQNIIDNYIKMENSPVGDAPETLCEEIIGWVDEHIINPIVNAAITIGEFIYNGLVAVGNFIVHAIDVVKEFLMKLWDTTVENVKRAVEVVKRVVDAAIDWVKSVAAKALHKITEGINKTMEWLIGIFSAIGESVYNAIFRGEVDGTVFKKISEFMNSPFMMLINMLPIIISGIYFAITAASLGIGALVMNMLQGFIVQLIIEAIVESLQLLHLNIPVVSDVLSIPGSVLLAVANAEQIEYINGAVAAMSFAGALLGVMIAVWIYRGPVAAQKAVVEVSKILSDIFSGYLTGHMDSVEFENMLTKVQNYMESKNRLFDKFREYGNELILTPIEDLQSSISVVTKLLVSGISGLVLELISLWDVQWAQVKDSRGVFKRSISRAFGLFFIYFSTEQSVFTSKLWIDECNRIWSNNHIAICIRMADRGIAKKLKVGR